MNDITSHENMAKNRPVFNGLKGRCPKCGSGRLFKSYLRLTDQCDCCGEPLGHIEADDGPPFFAMFIASFLCVPLGLAVHAWIPVGVWGIVAVLAAAALILTLVLLPLIKGMMVGVMWRHGLSGDDGQ